MTCRSFEFMHDGLNHFPRSSLDDFYFALSIFDIPHVYLISGLNLPRSSGLCRTGSSYKWSFLLPSKQPIYL